MTTINAQDHSMPTPRIILDGVEYVRADLVPKTPTGNRVVLVADRGWIFGGDMTRKNGRIHLARAFNVRSYRGVGIEGVIDDPTRDTVTIKSMPSGVDLPESVELFCCPVADDWGL